jgi:hypothetical protein
VKKNPEQSGDRELLTVTFNLGELHYGELMGLATTLRRKMDKIVIEYEKRLELLLEERGVDLQFETPINVAEVPACYPDEEFFEIKSLHSHEGQAELLKDLQDKIPEAHFYFHDGGYIRGRIPPDLLKTRVG